MPSAMEIIPSSPPSVRRTQDSPSAAAHSMNARTRHPLRLAGLVDQLRLVKARRLPRAAQAQVPVVVHVPVRHAAEVAVVGGPDEHRLAVHVETEDVLADLKERRVTSVDLQRLIE